MTTKLEDGIYRVDLEDGDTFIGFICGDKYGNFLSGMHWPLSQLKFKAPPSHRRPRRQAGG